MLGICKRPCVSIPKSSLIHARDAKLHSLHLVGLCNTKRQDKVRRPDLCQGLYYPIHLDFNTLSFHPLFELSSFLASSGFLSVADDDDLASLEVFFESSLVCPLWCSGFSVSLCHMDLRKPSFLLVSPGESEL